MESQQVFVCSADVAAFVDALETIGYPVVESHQIVAAQSNVDEAETGESPGQEGTYVIENADIVQQGPAPQPPMKRFRMNPKEHKEVIEKLFEEQKAVVTEKAFMNVKGNKRFKSDVWSWFGDVKLLISRSEAKKLGIPYYFRQCGDERMMLSKLFVGCFKCNALFIHDAQRSGTSTLRAHMRVCSRPRPRKKKGAPTIIFFPNKKNSCVATRAASEVDKVSAQEQVLNFILSTQSSFDVVDEPEFQKLLQMCMLIGATFGDINIESMLCPQEKLSDFLLNDLYMSSVNAFYTEFQYTYGATFAINVWMDEQQKSHYISAICHYANSAGDLKTVVMHTDEFCCESKGPEDVRDWFATLLSEMPVAPLKRLMLTDNLSNCIAAFRDEECVKCAYQSVNIALQNVIQKALSTPQSDSVDFVSLFTGCNDIVSYFEQIGSQYQLPEPLKSYKEGSWSSIVSMLRSVGQQYEDILNILNETGETHLLSVDRAIISAVADLFCLFEEAQQELSNGVAPTLNIVIPWITKLRKHCFTEPSDFPVVQQLKKLILAEVNERLASNVTVYHRVATLLDPRFKRLVFLPREDQIAANVRTKCLVKECMEAPLVEENGDEQRPQSSAVIKDRFSDLYSSNVSCDPGNSEKSAHKEVDNYLVEPFNPSDQNFDGCNKFNPLKFWAQNSDRYPNLSRVAFWILSCPASCVQAEESFWNNDWLVNCCRIHQKPDHVNKVVFIKSFKNL